MRANVVPASTTAAAQILLETARGVARALLSSAAEVARSRWQATGLYTTVAATNAGARALYADFGFVEVAAAAAAEGEEEGGSGVRGSLPATLVGRELLLRAEL